MEDKSEVLALPVLPLKNVVLFPHMTMPLSVGRPISIAAVEAALSSEEKLMVVVAQRDPNIEEPKPEDLFSIGTKSAIRRMTRAQDGTLQVLMQGLERVVILRIEQMTPYMRARVSPLPILEENPVEVEALHRAILDQVSKALSLLPQVPEELHAAFAQTDDPVRLAYLLATILNLDLPALQSLLEARTKNDLLRLLFKHLTHEVQVLELRHKIASQAQQEMTREQREYFLRQQLRAIQRELGEIDPHQAEANLLRERLEQAELPEFVRKEVERELNRLEKLPSMAPDYHVIRTYLELILELPWNRQTEDNLDLANVRRVLDEDHYGLQDVKHRILEHLAVLKLNPEAKAPILCFVGPPGVGKTSLGQSIARALGRKFERLSLGGLHDEAELRGHRRTYIGAMPGRIIQAIRRAGVKNPLLMLDEVDKIGRDFRGDPAAALLEILDPEQNHSFRDNYLDLPFDLSKVFFITTANTLDTIPRPLLDRMEVLRLPGYSEEEKVEIARRHLVPKKLKETGLTTEQLQIPDETLRYIIARYTREAGVRQLERAIAQIARKVALRIAEGHTESVLVKPEDLPELLGPERFFPEEARKELPIGVATGVAWTETGGEVLYIEAALLPGGKGLTLTGQLGEIMQESAKAAESYIWSHADAFGIPRDVFEKNGVHIHVPAGAIPKDGPSAGIAMVTALASLYTGIPVRTDVAMTGEITLSGVVLPVGGIKEKVLAARRAGIRRIILPRPNEKDLRELPEQVREEMEFIFVERIEDAIGVAIPELAERLERFQEAPARS